MKKQAATILVPVDFSSHSRAAAERACVVARACNFQIRLIHSIQLPDATVDYAFSGSILSDLCKSESAELEDFRRAFADRGPSVSTCFEEGDPTNAIRAAARAPDVELIVMGSHGRRGLDRFLLGSIAERTLQGAPVPVLIVREDEAEAAKEIRSILFATDFSEEAEEAERFVAQWAQALGAELEVFHSIGEMAVLFAPYAVSGSSDYEGQMMVEATRRIKDVTLRFQRAGVSAKSKIVYGFASEEIIRRAESTAVQIIAMGTRGHSGLQRFGLGSVVQRVLRHAPSSVLVAGSRPSNATT